MHVAEEVMSRRNITQAAKRRVKQAGMDLIGNRAKGSRTNGEPTTQTIIEDGQWVEHRPTASLRAGGFIEFLITGSGNDYLDLASTCLYVRAKVTKADGTDLDTDNPVEPVNSWLHPLFSQVDVSVCS